MDGNVEARGQERQLHLVAQRGVAADAPFHIEVARQLRGEVGELVKLVGFQRPLRVAVRGVYQFYQHPLGRHDVVSLEQRRMQSILNGVGDAVLTLAVGRGYDGRAALAKRRLDVGHIHVYVALLADDF